METFTSITPTLLTNHFLILEPSDNSQSSFPEKTYSAQGQTPQQQEGDAISSHTRLEESAAEH